MHLCSWLFDLALRWFARDPIFCYLSLTALFPVFDIKQASLSQHWMEFLFLFLVVSLKLWPPFAFFSIETVISLVASLMKVSHQSQDLQTQGIERPLCWLITCLVLSLDSSWKQGVKVLLMIGHLSTYISSRIDHGWLLPCGHRPHTTDHFRGQ